MNLFRGIAATCLILALGAVAAAEEVAAEEAASKASQEAVQATPAAATEYRLVWADEFDRDGPPDPANWTYERGFVRNEELQWYQPDNARCEGGLLVIEARREKVKNANYTDGRGNWQRSREYAEYTSSCLITRGRHDWTYGRFEMRGRIDIRAGLWPAWWALGTRRGWPDNGEIDMMEYYRGDLLANACWAGQRRGTQAWDTVKTPVADLGGDAWAKEFHVWRMDWDRELIRLYVDDKLLNTIELSKTINPGTSPVNPFTEPHYMLLNMAIGGQQGGDPSATEFPARFEVDYVRVYQPVEATP